MSAAPTPAPPPARPRPPTIIDVARAAGVSKSVVSRVLTDAPGVSPATRERVRDAAGTLGYVANAMARGMVARRTRVIGAFVRDVSTPFYGHLLTHATRRAAERGYRLVVATGSGRFAVDDERAALETLVGLRVEALVVASGLLPVEAILPMARRVPTVVAGRPETDADLSSIYGDEVGGGRGLADHVAWLGHRRVAVAGRSRQQSLTMATRSAAMAQRLAELGADVVHLPLSGPSATAAMDAAVAAALAAGTSALMTPSDADALLALEALARRGARAPDDLSITGYDGIAPLSSPVLGLTTWAQPLAAVGAGAVDDVVEQLDGAARATRHLAVDGHLVAGRTAGPARQPR